MREILRQSSSAADKMLHKLPDDDTSHWLGVHTRINAHHKSTTAMMPDLLSFSASIYHADDDKLRFEALANMIGMDRTLFQSEFQKIEKSLGSLQSIKRTLGSYDDRIKNNANAISQLILDKIVVRNDLYKATTQAKSAQIHSNANRNVLDSLRARFAASEKSLASDRKSDIERIGILEAYLYAIPAHMRDILKTAVAHGDFEAHSAALQTAMVEDGLEPERAGNSKTSSLTVLERLHIHESELEAQARSIKESKAQMASRIGAITRDRDALQTRLDEQQAAFHSLERRMIQFEIKQREASKENAELRETVTSLRRTALTDSLPGA